MSRRATPDGSVARPWRRGALVLSPVVLVLLVGAFVLGQYGPNQHGATPGARPSATRSTGAASDEQLPPALVTPSAGPSVKPAEPELARWGGQGTRLAMVLRNPTQLEIRYARVLVTALDAQGHSLGTRSAAPGAKCCTVLGLAPGDEFGLFADLGIPVSRIDQVRVTFLDVLTAPVTAAAPRVQVSDPVLSRTPTDAVVTATLTASGPVGPLVAGQAFLTAPDGRLVAVISGRFYCFADKTQRRLRMQLLHPVPAGTRIQRVLAHPIPAGVPAITPRACT